MKWFSRVLMNAPIQGTVPWFYNAILPMGEDVVLKLVAKLYYKGFAAPKPKQAA
jgi:hypothetical protein